MCGKNKYLVSFANVRFLFHNSNMLLLLPDVLFTITAVLFVKQIWFKNLKNLGCDLVNMWVLRLNQLRTSTPVPRGYLSTIWPGLNLSVCILLAPLLHPFHASHMRPLTARTRNTALTALHIKATSKQFYIHKKNTQCSFLCNFASNEVRRKSVGNECI